MLLQRGLQRSATAENSPASSEKRLATLEKRLNKRFGRRNAALGSGSEGKEAAKRVSRRQRGAQGLEQPRAALVDGAGPTQGPPGRAGRERRLGAWPLTDARGGMRRGRQGERRVASTAKRSPRPRGRGVQTWALYAQSLAL